MHPLPFERGEFVFKGAANVSSRWKPFVVPTVLIPSALAVNAVERADFPVLREQINSQRCTEPSAVNRPEYRIFP